MSLQKQLNFPCVVVLVASFAATSHAAIVDFENGTWDFGSGSITGWQQPGSLDPTPSPYSGTTSLSNSIDATFTATDVGGVIHSNSNTANHLTSYEYDTGNGLYLTQSSGSAYNDRDDPLANFLRIDIELSKAAYVDFLVHDIDTSNNNWLDAVYIESFSSGFGDPGDGTQANYLALGTDLLTAELHNEDLLSVLPDFGTGNPPSTIIDDARELTSNSAQFGFDVQVQYISLYYWNLDEDASFDDNQLIHLSGVEVLSTETEEVPEPRSWALLLITACGAVFFQYRHQRKLKPATAEANSAAE